MSQLNIEKIPNMSFEEAMKELENIVSTLENDNESLDKAIKSYEYGHLLQKHCQQKLKEAKIKVEKIIESNDGNVSSEEINLD